MTGLLIATLAAVAIALGHYAQTRSDKTAGYAVLALIVTGALSLLAPTLLGLPTIWLFGTTFAFAFGCHIVYKQKMRAWARSYRRSQR